MALVKAFAWSFCTTVAFVATGILLYTGNPVAYIAAPTGIMCLGWALADAVQFGKEQAGVKPSAPTD